MIEQLLHDPHRLAALAGVALLDTPIEAAFDRFTRLARLAVDAPIALIVLLDADRQFFKSTAGVPAAVASARQTPLSYSLCQHMLVTQTPLVIPDLRAHPLVRDNPTVVEFGMGAYVGIRLVTDDGHMLGSLCVYDTVSRAWTEREVAILADLAVLVMTEIALQERVRREEALTHATTHDSLTRLPNRSSFLARLARALAAPDSRPHSRAVLFVDLDGFKAINDRHGHAVGDQALIAVATRLEGSVRVGDTVARFGSDEFLILLEEIAGAPEAEAVAARIGAALLPPLRVQGITPRVTANIGIALNTATSTPTALLQQADRAMYRAKRGGKARFERFRAPS